MQNGQLQLEELIQKIQRHSEASYRIVLKKEEETYALLTALVDISPEPPTPAWSLANYGRYAFLAGKLSGEDLCQWRPCGAAAAHLISYLYCGAARTPNFRG